MPHYNAEFSVLGSTHTNCDCGGTYQLVALSHFGYLRHKYLKAYK